MQGKHLKDEMNEKQYRNKQMLFCYGIVVAVLFIAYMIELVKGNRTLGYTVVFSLILLVPFAISVLLYRADCESIWIRKVAFYGYGILYAFVLFTSVSVLAFAYILPSAKVREHLSESFITIWSYEVFMESDTEPIPQKASKKTNSLRSRFLSANNWIIGSVRLSLLPKYLINDYMIFYHFYSLFTLYNLTF